MTKAIILSIEGSDLQKVGIMLAGELTPQEAQAMCQAATRYFQEALIEAEVQRRMANSITNTSEEKEEITDEDA